MSDELFRRWLREPEEAEAELARLRESERRYAETALNQQVELDRLREENKEAVREIRRLVQVKADKDAELARLREQLGATQTMLDDAQGERDSLREKYESAKAMYNGPLADENARLREARDAWVKERAGHCREIARLRKENEKLRDYHREDHSELARLREALRAVDRRMERALEELNDPAWDLHVMTQVVHYIKKARATIAETD